MKGIALLLVVSIVAPAAKSDEFASCPVPLATFDRDGETLTGSRQGLLEAYRGGRQLRVGWRLDWNADGIADITHWTTPPFISEYQGELFAQISEIHRQVPRPEERDILLPDRWQKWTGLISTRGTLHGRTREDRSVQTWQVESHWCDATPAMSSCHAGWQTMVATDTDGKVLEGDKQALFEAVRRGWQLRVAWGTRSGKNAEQFVEHVAEPVFVTVTSGQELFAQLPEHIAQRSYWVSDDNRFDQAAVMWRGLLGTDGTFDAIWVNRANGETLKRKPQRARVRWFAEVQCPERAAIPLGQMGGVILDDNLSAR